MFGAKIAWFSGVRLERIVFSIAPAGSTHLRMKNATALVQRIVIVLELMAPARRVASTHERCDELDGTVRQCGTCCGVCNREAAGYRWDVRAKRGR